MISSSNDAGFDFVDVDPTFEIELDSRFGVRLFRSGIAGLVVTLVR